MLKRPVTVTTGCMIYAFLKVVYQAWKTVFNRISKHQEEILKCDMQQVFLTNFEVFGAVMFDIQMSSITHTISSSSQLLQCNMVTASVLFKSLSTCVILYSRNEYHHVTKCYHRRL